LGAQIFASTGRVLVVRFLKIKQWQRKKERKRNNFLPPLKGGGKSQ